MKKSLPWLALFSALLLLSCASKKDANEKNFSEALNSYLAKRGQICLGIPTTWPVDLNEAERRSGMGRAAEMAALITLWLGHARTLTDRYATQLRDDEQYRSEWCERAGLGFSVVTLLHADVVSIDTANAA